jgi:tetratricopeptide (TPR) repeat protein
VFLGKIMLFATQTQTEKRVTGIAASLRKRRIEKLRHRLGNGHDAELHANIGQLFSELGQNQQALHAYKTAVETLIYTEGPLDHAHSDQLIEIYKQILTLAPSDDDIAEHLADEYRRRGMDYRAIALYLKVAERYTRQGDYYKAIRYYHQILDIEPGSISTRQTCAYLYCHLRKYTHGAKEYLQIGDTYYEHQKFDGALEYYRKAAILDPESTDIQQRILLARRIVEGDVNPSSQKRLQALNHIAEAIPFIEDKTRIAQELHQNIRQVQYQYRQSFRIKQERLRTTRRQLNTLAAHVNSLEEHLQTIAQAQEQLREQLAREIERKHDLGRKLTAITSLQVTPDEHTAQTALSQQHQRMTSAMNRLSAQKIPLLQRLREDLVQVSQREKDIRDQLDQYTTKHKTLTQHLDHIQQQRHQLEQLLQKSLAKSLRHEKALHKQFKKLLKQYKQILHKMMQEKRKRTSLHARSACAGPDLSADGQTGSRRRRQTGIPHLLSHPAVQRATPVIPVQVKKRDGRYHQQVTKKRSPKEEFQTSL